jgi:hypothetical protein
MGLWGLLGFVFAGGDYLSHPAAWSVFLLAPLLVVSLMVTCWPATIAFAPVLIGILVILPVALPLLLLALPLLIVWILAIRFKEKRDLQTDAKIDEDLVKHIRTLTRSEDHVVQNQLTHLVDIKPGRLRLATLRVFLAIINWVARFFQRDGQLGGIPTIHFARWIIIDNGRRLIFLSNFDGSWEEYLGDFVDRAAWGLTGIWSNTVLYPKTRWLVLDGARDEQRFKTWTREHQIPAQVWYSRQKRITSRNIVNNKAIRNGLYARLDPQQAREWLRRL